MSDKNVGGRPLKFKSVKELQTKIDRYFEECDPHWEDITSWNTELVKGQPVVDEDGRVRQHEVTKRVLTKQIPYTITGLALALDTSRETLLDYEEKDKFSDTIKKAKARCHSYAERQLFGGNPTGPIFNLKNNYAWRDKTETDITTKGKPVKSLVEFVGADGGTDTDG